MLNVAERFVPFYQLLSMVLVGFILTSLDSAGAQEDSAVGYSYNIEKKKINVIDALSLAPIRTNINDERASVSYGSLTPADEYILEDVVAPRFYERDADFRVRPTYESSYVKFGIIGNDDDRLLVHSTEEFPYSSVSKILFRSPSSGKFEACTGFVVSTYVVITAGHCVYSGGSWHEDFLIFTGLNGGWAHSVCEATHLFALEDWIAAESRNSQFENDLGAIRMNCPAGNTVGQFKIGTPSIADSSPVRLLGYPCDGGPPGEEFREGGQFLSEDRIRAETDTNFFYQNDTSGCMSGAPLFLSSEESTVIGIHTRDRLPDNSGPASENNSGTRLTTLKINLILSWIQNVE